MLAFLAVGVAAALDSAGGTAGITPGVQSRPPDGLRDGVKGALASLSYGTHTEKGGQKAAAERVAKAVATAVEIAKAGTAGKGGEQHGKIDLKQLMADVNKTSAELKDSTHKLMGAVHTQHPAHAHAATVPLADQKHYPVCIRHDCATEWHYYHMFEMNLDAIIDPLVKHRAKGGAVVLVDALKPAMLSKWVEALVPGPAPFDVVTEEEGYTCGETVQTRLRSFEVHATIRDVAYAKLGLDVHGPAAAKPVVCYFDRVAKYVSDNAGDHQRKRARSVPNKAELVKIVEQQGYEFRDLVFGDEASVPSDPLKQVKAVSECDLAFGLHGGQLTNLLFMRPGGKAMQIVPYGLKAEDKIDVMYSAMAKFAGLEYTRWAPRSNEEVSIDWDQLLDDTAVKEKVCAYGVDNLYQHGTNQFVQGADTTWLAVFFYINQDIRVDPRQFAAWLGHASNFPAFHKQQQDRYHRNSGSLLETGSSSAAEKADSSSAAEKAASSSAAELESRRSGLAAAMGSYLTSVQSAALSAADRVGALAGLDAFAATRSRLRAALDHLDVDAAREYCRQRSDILPGALDD